MVESDEAGREASPGERDGSLEEAFAASDVVGECGEVCFLYATQACKSRQPATVTEDEITLPATKTLLNWNTLLRRLAAEHW